MHHQIAKTQGWTWGPSIVQLIGKRISLQIVCVTVYRRLSDGPPAVNHRGAVDILYRASCTPHKELRHKQEPDPASARPSQL